MTIRWILLPIALTLLACPASPPPPSSEEIKTTTNVAAEDPCRGAALELHALKDRCNVKRRSNLTHPEGLDISIEPSPVMLSAGAEVPVTVRFKNTQTSPLEIIVARGCGIYSSAIVDDKGQAVDLEGIAPQAGGLCASLPPVKVTLEPDGGHLDVQVLVSGLKQRWVAQGNGFIIAPGEPIPPGKYTLKLQSPYVDLSGKGLQEQTARWISTALEISE